MVAPMHSFVFPSMISKIAGGNSVKQDSQTEPIAS